MTETDPVAEEIEDIVANASADEPPAETEPDDGEAKVTTRKRRARVKTNKKKEDNGQQPPKEQTLEELDAEALLDGKVLPAPAENVKRLGDIYAKYSVGDNPEFRVEVWRTWPKMKPGGIKFDGFYDSWDIPLSLEQIQSEYGGGQFRIAVVGPHPTNPRLPKQYDSVRVSLAGDPKWERVPRALQGAQTEKDDSALAPIQMPQMVESPKLAEAALKIVSNTADQEREERRRVEERAERRADAARDLVNPVVEAERRRADDVVAVERERAAAERRNLEERLEDERKAREEERRAREELRQQMDNVDRNRPSMGQEIASLAQAGLFKSGDDSGVAKDMLTQVLEKHRGEIEGVQRQNTVFVESIRSSHQSEVGSMRDAHRREIEAEREASRSRESRIEDRLTVEREERRRDQDRFRQTMEERDRQWTDRMAQSKQMVEQSWESRHSTLVSTYENRNQWLQNEIDRLKGETNDLRAKREEQGDPIAQIQKMSEMTTAIKELTGAAGPAQPSGGIGISGNEGDWKSVAASEFADRVPDLADKVISAFKGTPAAAPPQYTPGQVVNTAQGVMVVVQAPDGQLALTPKQAFDEHQRVLAGQQGGGLLPQPGQPRPRVMPDANEMGGRRRASRQKVSAVQNLAEGLPKRRPPWEGGPPGDAAQPPQQQPPREQPRMTSRPPEEQGPPTEPMQLNNQERQAINMIAVRVHESVMTADEPEEFVAAIMAEYPPAILKQIAGYTTDDIIRGIVQVQPTSAGATPAGQQFVRQAFRQLREALKA